MSRDKRSFCNKCVQFSRSLCKNVDWQGLLQVQIYSWSSLSHFPLGVTRFCCCCYLAKQSSWGRDKCLADELTLLSSDFPENERGKPISSPKLSECGAQLQSLSIIEEHTKKCDFEQNILLFAGNFQTHTDWSSLKVHYFQSEFMLKCGLQSHSKLTPQIYIYLSIYLSIYIYREREANITHKALAV